MESSAVSWGSLGVSSPVLCHSEVDVTFSCITFHRKSGLHSSQQRNVLVRLWPGFVGLGWIEVELPG